MHTRVEQRVLRHEIFTPNPGGTPRLTIHDFLHGNHAPTFGVQGQTQHAYGNRNLIVTWQGRRCNAATAMSLQVEAGAAIKFTFGPTAYAGKAGCSRLRKSRQE